MQNLKKFVDKVNSCEYIYLLGVSDMKEHDKSKEAHETEEPWLPIETKLVVISVVSGVVAMVLFAILIHLWIL